MQEFSALFLDRKPADSAAQAFDDIHTVADVLNPAWGEIIAPAIKSGMVCGHIGAWRRADGRQEIDDMATSMYDNYAGVRAFTFGYLIGLYDLQKACWEMFADDEDAWERAADYYADGTTGEDLHDHAQTEGRVSLSDALALIFAEA